MPTFNQLVRKGREAVVTKSTAPANQVGYNTQKKKATAQSAPQTVSRSLSFDGKIITATHRA